MRQVTVGAIAVLLSVAACTGSEKREVSPQASGITGAPQRFGFGGPADSAKLAAWAINVFPDGEGLPPGSGTVDHGAEVYVSRCAGCHGREGEGSSAARLVGREPWSDFPTTRTIGNYWPYSTTLFDYIRRAMPMEAPGSLSTDDTYAVIAYLLELNGLLPPDGVMNSVSLPTVAMPARDRFVPDDRPGGPASP